MHIFYPEFKGAIQRRSTPSLPTLLLFAARVILPPYATLGIYFQLQPTWCQPLFTAFFALYSVNNLIAYSIFAARAIAISRAKLWLRVFIWVYVFALFGLWIVWTLANRIDTLTPAQLSADPYQGTCYNVHNTPEYSWGQCASETLVYSQN